MVGDSIKDLSIFFLFQFTERGHIFVKVHLAEHSKGSIDSKYVNGISDSDLFISGGREFQTLSGCEAADDQNSWDNFKHLIADEDFQLNGTPNNMVVSKEGCGHVTLMVSVEDTGIGILLHAQNRVFMPFMQADSSTSRNYGGTGIGLSISKCLVELMGGQINFISRPQIGSTFSFTAVLGKCKKNSINDMKKPSSEELPPSFRGMKAIIVDRKHVRASVTRYHLKRLGVIVEVTSTINMAASLCRENGSTVPG